MEVSNYFKKVDDAQASLFLFWPIIDLKCLTDGMSFIINKDEAQVNSFFHLNIRSLFWRKIS